MTDNLFLTAALAAFAAAGAAAQTAPSVAQIAARLTANDLKADVSFLASDALQGRGTPSPGQEVAGEYIAAQFRRAGLEPAAENYFQTAEFSSVTPNLDGLVLTFEIGGKAIQAERASLGIQEAVAADLTHAAAVKLSIEDAAALDALTPEQTRGKVLILELHEAGRGAYQGLRRLLSSLAKLQPALVIVLRAGGPPMSQTARLRETAAPAPSTPVLVVVDPAVQSALAALKPGPLEATVSAHIPAPTVVPVKVRNVAAILRGSDAALRDTYVLVTAHYDHLGVRGTGPGDHIYNGANDDASGTASVIEIANALAALPARPKRSIVFLTLFGEELGLVGSRYYAQHPLFPLAKTIGDINLEQMGRTDVDGGSSLGLVNATGYDFTTLTAVLRAAGQEAGIQVAKDEKNSDQYYGSSDNQPLADAGVPSHTLSVGYMFPDYHQPGDEWPKLDYDNMAKVDRAVALALFRIADSQDAPQWNAANPKTARYVHARENPGASAGPKTQ